MSNNKHIILMIDNSYSMIDFMNNILIALNKYIYTLKSIYNNNNTQTTIFITVVFFTNTLHYVCKCLHLKDVGIFDNNHIGNSGTTSLYDNICEILSIFKYQSLDENNLFIISDGADTSSRLYTKTHMNDAINELIKGYNWNIINCNTDLNNINIMESEHTKNIKYDLNEIDSLFTNLSLY